MEEEKRKHAQDTAQGDDVTYLLEKERERLHQENQFERQQNRCMEKDIKCLTETLEQERQRQKQIVLLLLAERKRLIFRYAEEKQKCDRLSQVKYFHNCVFLCLYILLLTCIKFHSILSIFN